jgi:hypothetical protein
MADSDGGCMRSGPAEDAIGPMGEHLNEATSRSALLVFSNCRNSSLERSGACVGA